MRRAREEQRIKDERQRYEDEKRKLEQERMRFGKSRYIYCLHTYVTYDMFNFRNEKKMPQCHCIDVMFL